MILPFFDKHVTVRNQNYSHKLLGLLTQHHKQQNVPSQNNPL